MELYRCCARVSRAAALVRQHIDGVARASSAGTKSESSARSLVLLTLLAPVSRTARFRDQLHTIQLDDESNSKIADGSDPGTCTYPGHFRRFANFQRQLATAGPRISGFCVNTHRKVELLLHAQLPFGRVRGGRATCTVVRPKIKGLHNPLLKLTGNWDDAWLFVALSEFLPGSAGPAQAGCSVMERMVASAR